MSFIVVDVEADGPCPGLYSMVSFGAVIVEPSLSKTFMRTTAPISDKFVPDALAVSGVRREEHMGYLDPAVAMADFEKWIEENSKGRHIFISDNPAFDWQWINYYFHANLGRNPFGHSARRLGDIYAGIMRDASATGQWKKFRKTKHTHNPVDDAMGMAEGLLAMKNVLGLRINLSY